MKTSRIRPRQSVSLTDAIPFAQVVDVWMTREEWETLPQALECTGPSDQNSWVGIGDHGLWYTLIRRPHGLTRVALRVGGYRALKEAACPSR